MKKSQRAKRLASHVAVLATTILMTAPGFANPVLDNVAAGQATVQQVPNSTVVNQTSQKAIINWQSFNIGAAEKTHFQQPAGGIALNRINPGQGASQIYGHLSATGKIILVNQAGIFFGPGSFVNVGGIIASTSDISDANFMAGKYKFDQPSPYNGSVINQGTIRAAKNGLVALIGTGVRNDGTIEARSGSVVLASGNKFTVDLAGDGLVNFTVDEATPSAGVDHNGNKLKNAVSNSGTIVANGGTIIMTARTARGVVDNAINMRGVAIAHSVSKRNGMIILDGGDGNVRVAGRIDVSGKHKNTQGGTVKILANNIRVKKSAVIDASGYAGGGEILIGGNQQGKGPEQNALSTHVDTGALIKADAIQKGNGGKVIVWSDNDTHFYGSISAQGGAAGGDGGFVETSGHYLDVANAKINLLAPLGATGTWLLDPENLTIQTTGPTTATFASNTFTGNVDDSILTVTDLQNALATASITVLTGAGGSQAGDITIANSFTWSNANKLVIGAYRNITINAGVTISNTAGGSLTLQANNTAAFNVGSGSGIVTNNGTLTLSNGGQVVIRYNPTSYTAPVTYTNTGNDPVTAYMLVNNVNELQNINFNAATLNGSYAINQRIDASATSGWNGGAGFVPIGNSVTPFTGIFEGENHTIVNLYINNPALSNVGLLGATSNATISDVGLISPVITGNQNVGALIGRMSGGTVSVSYASGGLISGASNVGGLIGNIQSGTVSDLANTSAVSASGAVAGGIAGVNQGTIQTSYSQGYVTAASSAGGLVGSNNGTGTATSSYWDTQTSGQSTSAGGTGNTTAQLQAALPSGFSSSIWRIVAGISYPYLVAFNSNTPRILSGTASLGGGNPLALANNGSQIDTAVTGANGYFYFQERNGTIANSAPYLIYLNNASAIGNILGLTAASNGSTTSLSLIANAIQVNTGSVGFSTSNMASAAGSLTNPNILYSVSGGNLTLGNATNPNVTLQASGSGAFGINHVISSTGTTTGMILNAPTIFNTAGITTSGAQTYNGAVTVSGSSVTTLTSSGASGITFNDTLTGVQGVSIGNGSGAITFSSNTTLSLDSLFIGTGDTTAINTSNITTTGAQTYNSPVNFGAGILTTLTSSGAGGITFGSTLNGARGLRIGNNSGTVTFNGVVGGTSSLTSLLIGTGDTTAINTTGITTSGAQTYNSAVNLGAGSVTTLTSSGGAGITFGSTLNGPQGLSIGNSSGAVTFNGAIGGTSSLASLSMGTGDTTTMNTNNVTTSGSQTYNSDLNLGASGLTTFTTDAGNISLYGALIGGTRSLTLTGGTGGDHVFALNDVASIGTLTIDGNASVANTIDFSGYVVPVVLYLAPPVGNELDSGSLTTDTSSPIGSFSTIQTAIGTNTGQSVLVLPNVSGITVTYTNPAHTSGIISDPFVFINFIIANPPTPTPTPTPTPEPGPTPVDITNVISGTTSYFRNNENMDIIVDGEAGYYDYFGNAPWVGKNIDALIKQQNAIDQSQTTKLTCHATSIKDPALKDCRLYPVRPVSEF